jgi:hypothetical protein
MAWIKSEKYASGMTMWTSSEDLEHYPDLTIHQFDNHEGFTVSFERHYLSRFKSVEDAIEFVDCLVSSHTLLEEKQTKKTDAKSKRNKNVNNLDNI